MEQTAVEWLIEQINQDYPEITWAYKDECDKAKAMEKEQIIDNCNECASDIFRGQITIGKSVGEQFYLKKYKK